MKTVPTSRAARRIQYAALPYRQRQDGEIQIRLITSRETRRWVIPKGWPMKGFSPSKAAAREAYEEAGLLGSISSTAIGLYSYDKRLTLQTVPCDVMVFPLKVKRYVKKWPERSERFGFWFSVESAAAAVQEDDLRLLILSFGELMAARFAIKRSRNPAGMAAESGAPGARAEDADRIVADANAQSAEAHSAAASAAKFVAKAKGEQKAKSVAKAKSSAKAKGEVKAQDAEAAETSAGTVNAKNPPKAKSVPKAKVVAKAKTVAKSKTAAKGKAAAVSEAPVEAAPEKVTAKAGKAKAGKASAAPQAKGKAKGQQAVLTESDAPEAGWASEDGRPRPPQQPQLSPTVTRH